MIIHKNLNERAFRAIQNGTKKIEIRANKNKPMNVGDKIIFNNELVTTIVRVSKYKTVRELLECEGTKYTLSSTNDIEEGIKSIESIPNYKEIIQKNGVLAIELDINNVVERSQK